MATDIRTELITVLQEDLSIDPALIDDESHLVGELGFDSVTFAMSVVAIEERLGTALPANRLQECETVRHVIDLIKELRSSDGAAG